jgi:YegS/Rv2252/BmrU family lipid kinase
MKQIACIYNQGSGTIADKFSIKKTFSNLGVGVEFFAIKLGKGVVSSKLAKKSYVAVVAAGGDGTVNFTAQLAIETKHTLGILPLGTLNHFAKDLGLPLDLDQAAQIAVKGKLTEVDYCTVNGHIFLNNSSIGLYPTSVQRRDKVKQVIGKWLAILISSLRALLEINALSLKLDIDGDEMFFKTPLVFMGNNSYEYKKVGFTNRTNISEGKLFVYIVRSARILSLISTTFLFYFGMHKSDKNYMKLTSKKVVVNPRKKHLHISVDGEVISVDAPLIYQIHPSGLTVRVGEGKRLS